MQTGQEINSGNLQILKPRKALNKAFLKVKPNRSRIEQFKENLKNLLDRTNDTESEEFHKNLVTDFLKKTYYDPDHFINTKGRNDLVIHNGKKAKSTVGVIIEAKKPTNRSEMISKDRLNVKAFQELVLYYLRERISQKNLEVKYLVATNINEWFIFDANLFEKAFAQNKRLVKQFEDFEAGRLAGKTTDFFYREIAEPFITQLEINFEFTYFDIRNYERPLRNNNPKDDNKLIALFKLLSPEHLLKLPFTNDSNSLDKRFYGELLHIIGLTETKQGGKKIIERQKEGQRNSGSFLENAIIQLDSMDKIGRLENPSHFGDNHQVRLFNVGLELSITWLNRILFLKLLEAQLITYHKGDRSYEFLSLARIHNYDDLNSLFFQVLARQHNERNEDVKALFEKVPYLNSSLFEPTDIEHATLFISNLRDDKELPVYSATVLKDKKGKKRSGNLNALEYLFEFLDAYDFSSEGGEAIQEDNKTLINASVLGLIFEKINGYKDGSFFTPGFITMYMCRETIRKAVVQKFNEAKEWKCKDLDDLYDCIEDRKEANELINSLKICDPAVGSGHFLVSVLNEMIAIKNDLNILQDRTGRRLKEYQVEVVNDELVVTDEEGELFEYNPSSRESQRVQEALFHEKQQIIENCLFGVDINPNSVKICRLRLWIELLKNAYYKNETELETLPNIDINIKCGNSLISRFDLDADLSKALKDSKWSIDSYRVAVDTYRNAQTKEQKRKMERIIQDIKNDFRSEISANDPKVKRLQKVKGEIFIMANQTKLFEQSKREKAAWNKKLEKLTKESKKLEFQIQEIKDNKIYENAFEWRFEFPEVLNDTGEYIGFDVVIGNPPYVQLQKIKEESEYLSKMGYDSFSKTGDIYSLFYELGFRILQSGGILTYITSNKWMRAAYGKNLRQYFVEKTNPLLLIDFGGIQVFDSATVDTNILIAEKNKYDGKTDACVLGKDFSLNNMSDYIRHSTSSITYSSESWVVLSSIEQSIKSKIEAKGTPLGEWDIQIYRGILTGYNKAFIIDQKTRDDLIKNSPKSEEIIRPILLGKDVKRYNYKWKNLWVIFTRRGTNIDEYPAVKNYLFQFFERLRPRNNGEKTGRKSGSYKWFEIQDNVAYFESFSAKKIAWGNLALKAQFTLVDENFYINAPSAFIDSSNLYILSVLNSKLADFYIKKLGVSRSGGYFEYKPMFVEKLPIPKILPENQIPFRNLVSSILNYKGNGKSTVDLEKKLELMVSDLYELNEEEKTFLAAVK